ncbi:MAG: type I restriction enzyme HsdR N-terminal domain-containing protein, partial [Bacteroidales bacterium]|nr:type I restriction enzyme HsdR N-terminal domain-containing protein [Bacteroidales bacterium]
AVRTQLIEPILNVLGWKTSNPKFVRPNAPDEDGKIPDYTLLKNERRTLIVEAKNLSIDLQDKKIIDQLASYCFKSGIDFGILTNGVKWLLFKTFEKNPKDRIVWQVDIEADKIEYVIRSLSSFSYSNIDTLDILLKKSKVLDNSWKELVESIDSIVSIISQKLLEKIKSTDPSFKIDSNDLKTFTKGKIEELFELAEIEEEEKADENGSLDTKTEFAEVEDVIFKRHQKSRIRENISVTFPDKTVFKNKKVVDTFVQTIKKIGPENVMSLNLYRAGVPIVSEVKDEFYNQHKIGKYWIMVHTSTKEKIAVLNEINDKLNLKLMIETFMNER